MRPQQIEFMLPRIFLLGSLLVVCGSVNAAPNPCAHMQSGTGVGGTEMTTQGTGIGGTGNPALSGEGQPAGNVIFSQGTVKAQIGGRSRTLAQGDVVCVGETIVTAQSGMAQIRMTDDGMVSVRPLTEFSIKEFVYSGTTKDHSLFALLKGALRVVTGKIGHRYPQNDLIGTPDATIGVRGTDHEATVIPPGGKYPAGVYDKVNTGITFIRTEKGEVDIHPNQVGFVANPGEVPVLLKEMPEFFSAATAGHENASPEAGGREEGSADHKGVEHQGEVNNPPEAPSDALPEGPGEIEQPELPEAPEIPSLPEQTSPD
jgi:FecR protein